MEMCFKPHRFDCTHSVNHVWFQVFTDERLQERTHLHDVIVGLNVSAFACENCYK